MASYMHILCFKNEDKSFATKISSTKDLVNFNLIYEFTTDTLPYAIEYYNNSFYVGTAYGTSSTCKDSSKNGSLYRIDLDKAKTYLSIDKNNETVTIFDDGKTYGVEYDLSSEKSVFKTTLEFDNTMTQRQWEEEYSKIENLKLMFATIADSKNINFNASTTYFNNVLSNNIPETSKTYVTATEYAQDMFKEELNIQDELFNITTAKISETQDEYKTLVTLTINKDSDFSALEPNDGKEDNNNNENSNDNSQTNNNTQTNGKNPVTNPNTQVNDYINNNNKLPQTGEFFGVKNILKVIRITAIVALVAIFITKKNKTRNNRRKR